MKISLLVFLLALVSCSYKVKESGGKALYAYDPLVSYSSENLARRAPDYVKTSMRDPSIGKLDELFAPGLPDIKKIGIISFEALIQPTYGGVSDQDSIYLSAAGKQLMAENLLRIWEQTLGVLGKEITYIKSKKINRSKTSPYYGLDVNDYVLVKREKIMPDDIFYLPKGKNTTYTALVNPRGGRDLSMLLVPANQIMGGPKFTETQKHYVNELCKELKLDAVLVVYSSLEWTTKGVDKTKNIDISEEMRLKLSTSLILPFSNYHKRLDLINNKDQRPQHNITYRSYDVDVRLPIKIVVPEEEKSFDTIDRNLLMPMMDVYSQLTQMIVSSLHSDVKKTF